MPQVRPYPILLILGILYSSNSFAAQAPEIKSIDPPKDILFIGNSYTYYNNSLHNALKSLIGSADMGKGYPGLLKAMTISGAKLVDHAPAVKAIVESRKWDVVVLQGHSREAYDKDYIKMFQRAARAYDKIIDESGAQTVFYMTWAPEDHLDYIESLNSSYSFVGNRTEALVVPVGLAFDKIKKEYPGIDLYRSDKSHPTVAGTYTAACVFFAAFYQKSPEGLVFPTSTSLNDEKAAIVQKVAWDTVQAYYGQSK